MNETPLRLVTSHVQNDQRDDFKIDNFHLDYVGSLPRLGPR